MSKHVNPLTLPARDPAGHKGTFGTVVVIGGQAGPGRMMIGGPALTALAALRTGAGLTQLALPETILPAALTIAPGATGIVLPVDEEGRLEAGASLRCLEREVARDACLVVGPGWGTGTKQRRLLEAILAADGPPPVIDADGLNAMAEGQLTPARKTILTPHPGEFRRLGSVFGIEGDPTAADERPELARTLARTLDAVVVLKGPGTVISDGTDVAINATGNAALATAGTGDVLAGIIAALVAQFGSAASPALTGFECARLGVEIHGRAADLWVAATGSGAGMLATDLVDMLPPVLAEQRSRG
ncbi:MAG: NAD(P)H-hydrate dehydratase [Phycisphaerales bacterium]|nr:NAD(P)H-hydrate dehydratase [Phycisphaerales bacterium]NNM27741.1 NAD(P)H-hydrate dehydratase [Phycisphaerales bacterium]